MAACGRCVAARFLTRKNEKKRRPQKNERKFRQKDFCQNASRWLFTLVIKSCSVSAVFGVFLKPKKPEVPMPFSCRKLPRSLPPSVRNPAHRHCRIGDQKPWILLPREDPSFREALQPVGPKARLEAARGRFPCLADRGPRCSPQASNSLAERL